MTERGEARGQDLGGDVAVNGQGAGPLPDIWQRVDVSSWELQGVEPTGTNSVVWLKGPDEAFWLHKGTKIPTNGVEQGEDRAEVVATQVASLLGVRAAATRLCVRDGRRGSLSKSFTATGVDLIEGGVVLQSGRVPGYLPHREGKRGG